MGEQVVAQCGWCGVKTALDERARYRAKVVEHDGGYEETQTWVLYQCVSCDRPTLIEVWYFDGTDEWEETTLLPSAASDNSSLPEPVARAYEAALAVRHVEPNAFAVLIGRMLEVVCQHEGAAGKNLVERLAVLADSGRIPGPLAEMAQQLRQIRNLGAHAAYDEVREADVPVISEFAEAILEYLYRAPAKVAAVEDRLTKNPRAAST
jgi:Domain of unknown function (DUF4145)